MGDTGPNGDDGDDDDDSDTSIDLGVDFTSDSSTAQQAIGHWLECLCHWHSGLSEIWRDYFKAEQKGMQLSINVLTPPPLVQPEQQATLVDTINGLKLSDEEEAKAWSTLAARADKELQAKTMRKSTSDKWSALATGREDERWQNLFTGRVHCEASLACLMEGNIVDAGDYHGGNLAVSLPPPLLDLIR